MTRTPVDLPGGRFWLGDTFDCMAEIPDGSVDMVLADLPYGITACKWDSVLPFDQLWNAYHRVCKPNAAIVLTAAQPFTSALGASNLAELRYSWTWVKSAATGHLNAKKRPMKNTEDVLVFYRAQPTYNPQGVTVVNKRMANSASDVARGITSDATSTVSGGISAAPYVQEHSNYPRQALEIPSAGRTAHPTQKPVALFEYLIRTYTDEGETVLDNTAGSGTTAVAANRCGRKWICIERDEDYFAKAVTRVCEEAAE